LHFVLITIKQIPLIFRVTCAVGLAPDSAEIFGALVFFLGATAITFVLAFFGLAFFTVVAINNPLLHRLFLRDTEELIFLFLFWILALLAPILNIFIKAHTSILGSNTILFSVFVNAFRLVVEFLDRFWYDGALGIIAKIRIGGPPVTFVAYTTPVKGQIACTLSSALDGAAIVVELTVFSTL
jgi:hypothetical protein